MFFPSLFISKASIGFSNSAAPNATGLGRPTASTNLSNFGSSV